MLRKSIALILSICMLLSLCACGSDNNDRSRSKKSSKKDKNEHESFETEENITPKDEEKLSESCSMVLCTGSDGNDFYEIVANQIDGYPDSTFEFGVIKNNRWLVPMSSDCPFIDDEGWWLGAIDANKPCDFQYLEEGCFYYECDNGDPDIIYKPETSISLNASIVGYPDLDYSINDKSEIIATVLNTDYLSTETLAIIYANMNTGELKTLPIEAKYAQVIGPLNDNLFFIAEESTNYHYGYDTCGFFDLNGNQVIDLYSYDIVDYKDCKFINGQYTFTAKNNSDVLFDITIDTTGKVISQVKVEE